MQLSEVFCRLCTQATDSSRRFAAKNTNKPRTQLPPAKTSGRLKILLGRWLMLPSASKWSFPPEFSDVICAPRFCRRLFLFPFGRVLTCARFPGSGRVQIVALAVRRCMGIQPARMVSQPSCVEKVGLYRVHYYCMCLICVAAFEKDWPR